ncbi:protein of unknown function [Modestobacter italicus]|uniref:Uncharacterized protein n=1 Tax=Modestobacter italicus (strain DSM 44449 / CECT 9708 / BC 501) TaxID=2732864 RepID=I4F3C7_MODI5|nr:hypothetical protein [Modestobacter marinus]CCH90140.1 protein of unknown function [Modestobacter marinus]
MLELNADSFLWDDEHGALREDELRAYGVSTALIARLRAWFDAAFPTAGAAADPETQVGRPWSLRLAAHLQQELPGYDVHLPSGRVSRPLHEWLP